MSDELQAWKPEDAVAALKERIRLEFASMIPPDRFAEMVRIAIKEFLRAKESGYQRRSYSDFDSVVIDCLTEATKVEVKKVLEGPEWRGAWDARGNQTIPEAIGKILADRGPEILNNWLGQAINQVVQNMQFTR